MTYWHKVKMICNSRFVASSVELLQRDSEAESKSAYNLLLFSAFSFWMNSTCLRLRLRLWPFINQSISHYMLRPLAVYHLIYFIFLLMAHAPSAILVEYTTHPPPPGRCAPYFEKHWSSSRLLIPVLMPPSSAHLLSDMLNWGVGFIWLYWESLV